MKVVVPLLALETADAKLIGLPDVKLIAWLAEPVYRTLSVTVADKVPLPVEVGL